MPSKQQKNCRNCVCSGNKILGKFPKQRRNLGVMLLQKPSSDGIEGFHLASSEPTVTLPTRPSS